MADISKLTTPYFVDNQTELRASVLNPIILKLNEVIDKLNNSTPTPTPTPEWQGYVDSVENSQNNEFVAIYLDANDKLIYGVRVDNSIFSEDISSDTTDKSYGGSEVMGAISTMESNGRPQQQLVGN